MSFIYFIVGVILGIALCLRFPRLIKIGNDMIVSARESAKAQLPTTDQIENYSMPVKKDIPSNDNQKIEPKQDSELNKDLDTKKSSQAEQWKSIDLTKSIDLNLI